MTEAHRTFQIRTETGHMTRARLMLPGELGDVFCAHRLGKDVPADLMLTVWAGHDCYEVQGLKIWRLSREGER